MTSFDYLIHKQKLSNLHDNILKPKIHFEWELIFIQWLDEKDSIKSMYINYVTYIFSITIGFMFVIHETLPNKKKLKKNVKFIYKIFSSFIQ
jgi:hypothetical protein